GAPPSGECNGGIVRVTTFAACAGTAAATLCCVAQPALADGVRIEPGSAMPGESVTVRGACDRPGDSRMEIRSRALRSGIAPLDADGRYTVAATVRYARSREYTVTVVCLPSRRSDTEIFHVRSLWRRKDLTAYPVGGPRTGGGGAARTTAGPDREDTGTPPVLLIGAVAAAVAGGVALARNRGRA
ncbi:MAG TPA: hypothetical protein VHJ17_22425, partial [Thermomonospora sp.]|nr:hypothetical protein [Thermomonospora sp.]